VFYLDAVSVGVISCEFVDRLLGSREKAIHEFTRTHTKVDPRQSGVFETVSRANKMVLTRDTGWIDAEN
jgi:hypothetical protein